MSLPNSTNLETLDYASDGQPFNSVAAKTGLSSTDFVFGAQPFFPAPDPSSPATNTTLGFIAFFF